ncbi:hypothetical protein [Herbaspirillum aquaticum]|uniref:hypothetical protein n=1 Tax=Herbaspirillum aquaticum TaxID=568783 RepID=UPI0024DEDDEC|nr:hypothetical protein [Herbaspirillum aquaticum]
MIAEFITRFEEHKEKLRALFAAGHPGSYQDIVGAVVTILQTNDDYDDSPDPNRVYEIDDGDYQGTLVYVIGAKGYQPSEYWYVKVSYGSCSVCDTLQRIREYSDEAPTESQVEQYMMLALHILQGLKRMGDDNQAGPFA